MKSWKTTLGGILLSLGTALSQVTDPAWVSFVGTLLVGAAGFFVAQARDNDVSSESAGAK